MFKIILMVAIKSYGGQVNRWKTDVATGYLYEIPFALLIDYSLHLPHATPLLHSSPDSPSILQRPASISVALGRRAELVCIPDGNPDPRISWLFQGTQIAGAEGPIYSIAMVTGGNGGQYTCMASNVIGTTSAVATLTVLCEYLCYHSPLTSGL